MARYAYDVNTTTRLIDVHKQFNGGLKTVDTDDALGAVFLRDAENVSISEFGFIEKRYGTYENQKRQIATGTLQGYWEFEGHRIYAINGQFFVDDETTAKTITKENEEWRYPNDIENFTLQTTRDMNAVNINRVLYIFTGTYPVYVDKDLNFYWFSVNIPTYDEIVVTGHNLLEDDYENLYFPEPVTYSPNGISSGTIENPIELREVNDEIQSNFSPKIPFADNGVIDFKFQYVIDEKYTLTDFNPSDNKNKYREIGLDSIQYRSSGSGASNLDFIDLDISSINFPVKNNYIGSQNIDLIRGFDLLSKVLSSQELDINTTGSQAPGFTNYELDFSISDDFSKEIFLENKTKIYTIEYNTGDPFNPYGVFKFDTTFFKQTFGLSAIPSERFAVTYDLEVIPLDSDGLEYPDLKVFYNSSALEFLDGVGYKFVLPSTIAAPEAITKYRLNFNGNIAFALTGEEAENYNAPETFRKRVSYAERILILDEDQQIQNFPDLSVQISDLLAGTYDFKINYYFKSFSYENDILGIFNSEDGVEIGSVNFYNVTITSEQLQDFPRKDADSIGIEYPTLKPIWTCNKVIEHFGKLMVWGSTAMPTAVFYSFPDRPFYFPQNFYLDFTNDENAPVEAVSNYMNILIVQTQDRTWGVRGNSGLLTAPSPYVPFTINPSVGTLAYKSVRPVRNHLFFLSKQGIIALKSLYAADEQYNIEFVDRNIFNIVPQDAQAVGIQFDNQYWLNFPNHRITLRWYIDKKAWVLDKYTAWSDFRGVFKYQIKNGKLEFITYPSVFDEENLTTYKIGVDYSLPTDLGGLVVAKMETSFLNQNYPFHPKNYKEAKLDFTLQNEYNISKDVIYFQEDITIEDSLYLDNVELLKNHRYRIYFYKLPKNLNLSTIVEFYAKERYQNDVELLGFEKIYDLTTTLTTPNQDPEADTQEHIAYIEFLIPNSIDGVYDIKLNFPENTTLELIDLDIKDSTYDNELNFLIWVLSENNTLNQDPIVDYGQAKVNIDINLQDRLGDWQFGQTDFGKKVTAVNTIKLSGKGYNAKVYLEDYSKSKWTLESLGLTYKMKRARSR